MCGWRDIPLLPTSAMTWPPWTLSSTLTRMSVTCASTKCTPSSRTRAIIDAGGLPRMPGTLSTGFTWIFSTLQVQGERTSLCQPNHCSFFMPSPEWARAQSRPFSSTKSSMKQSEPRLSPAPLRLPTQCSEQVNSSLKMGCVSTAGGASAALQVSAPISNIRYSGRRMGGSSWFAPEMHCRDHGQHRAGKQDQQRGVGPQEFVMRDRRPRRQRAGCKHEPVRGCITAARQVVRDGEASECQVPAKGGTADGHESDRETADTGQSDREAAERQQPE